MTYNEFWRQLAPLYGEGEAKAMARLVYEVRYGLSLADLLMGRDADVPESSLQPLVSRLLQQEPVQYVLGQASFCGRTFHVDSRVLIPRPETEELCRWVCDAVGDARQPGTELTLLDVGTGSGCIAVTLAAQLTGAHVVAWDVSEAALEVARQNAIRLHADVTFRLADIMAPPTTADDGGDDGPFDVIVSNPPYICNNERARMAPNVLEHEPHLALFVPDDDPLRFYAATVRHALQALRPGGWLYFEVNPLYAADLQELLTAQGFSSAEARHDQFGRLRFVRARR